MRSWDIAAAQRGAVLLHPRGLGEDRQALREYLVAWQRGEICVPAVPQEVSLESWIFMPNPSDLDAGILQVRSGSRVGQEYVNPVVSVPAPAAVIEGELVQSPAVAEASAPRGADASGPLPAQMAPAELTQKQSTQLRGKAVDEGKSTAGRPTRYDEMCTAYDELAPAKRLKLLAESKRKLYGELRRIIIEKTGLSHSLGDHAMRDALREKLGRQSLISKIPQT